MMGYGPKFFSESFLEGRVDQKYLAFTYIWSLTLKFGAVDFFLGNKQRTLTRMLSRQLLLPPRIEH